MMVAAAVILHSVVRQFRSILLMAVVAALMARRRPIPAVAVVRALLVQEVTPQVHQVAVLEPMAVPMAAVVLQARPTLRSAVAVAVAAVQLDQWALQAGRLLMVGVAAAVVAVRLRCQLIMEVVLVAYRVHSKPGASVG